MKDYCLVCHDGNFKLTLRRLCKYCKYKYCNTCSTKLLNKCSICYRSEKYINDNNDNNDNNHDNNHNNNENDYIQYNQSFSNTRFLIFLYNFAVLYAFIFCLFTLYYYKFI